MAVFVRRQILFALILTFPQLHLRVRRRVGEAEGLILQRRLLLEHLP